MQIQNFGAAGPVLFAAPSKFNGKSENWEPFKKKLKAYLNVMNAQFSNFLQEVEVMTSRVPDTWYMDSNNQFVQQQVQMSTTLQWILLSLREGSAETFLDQG